MTMRRRGIARSQTMQSGVTQLSPLALPERIYERNIIHNPSAWMGIWTPQGWRVHRKRWGRARRITKYLSGDGKTTFFPNALCDPTTGRVAWQDDLHLADDPFTDGGIYPCDPRIEYPVGRQRWAVSHSLLCYPVADHTLLTHEYVWDMTHGHVQTYFRHHVRRELARTDSVDGRTVVVSQRPISMTIEGNVHYPLPNSAVRGVWDNADGVGTNYYTQRRIVLMPMHNAVYGTVFGGPVVQCRGVYAVLPDDPVGRLFDAKTGDCIDRDGVIERLYIPLDEPKLAMLMPSFRTVPSRVYEGEVSIVANHFVDVSETELDRVRQRRGVTFEPGRAGYAGNGGWDGSGTDVPGYSPNFDLNGDGVIDEADEAIVARHVGRRVRANLYLHAYFGGDWITSNVCLDPEHRPGIPAIADYDIGGGYDAPSGTIRLLNTPGTDRPVWVEYFHDAPAVAGENNIRLTIYEEID